jgi:chromate reductase
MAAKVMVLVGGICRNSLNRRFFEAVAALDTGTGTGAGTGAGASTNGKRFEFTVFDITRLPYYSQDLEMSPPASVVEMKQLAAAADAILIVTPEYNRSIPGVLKNALDWGSRPHGSSVWPGKPTAIMGAAAGAIGTFGAQQHLRNILSHLDMPVMNQPAVYFNAVTGMMTAEGTVSPDGDRLTESSAKFLTTFLTAFEQWIARFR